MRLRELKRLLGETVDGINYDIVSYCGIEITVVTIMVFDSGELIITLGEGKYITYNNKVDDSVFLLLTRRLEELHTDGILMPLFDLNSEDDVHEDDEYLYHVEFYGAVNARLRTVHIDGGCYVDNKGKYVDADEIENATGKSYWKNTKEEAFKKALWSVSCDIEESKRAILRNNKLIENINKLKNTL